MRRPIANFILNHLCFWCVVVSPGISAVQVAAEDLKPEIIYQRILPSVMTLRVENAAGEEFIGSAFLALEEGVALTAWHVLRDARRVTANFADGRSCEVKGYIDKDEIRDLALIRVEVSGRPRAPLSREIPMVGSRAYVIGSPKGYEFSIGDGLISQIQTVDGVRLYQVSCPISAGNSGGPIVNERGEVVGITSWSKVDAQNLNFAVPARDVVRLNASLAATLWGQPMRRPATRSLQRTLEKNDSVAARSTTTSQRQSEPEPEQGFGSGSKPSGSLRDLLRRSVGREITVHVTEDGQSREYRFTVPGDLVR